MAAKPILIIQMQRLGDLVLSYPLMGWLSRLYPENPLWVMGEKMFFSELMQLSPSATYFDYSDAPGLLKTAFHSVINISHRAEAADLAGVLDTEQLVGAHRDKGTGFIFINGDWQIYRASLVNNNRYNLYHWADMNALDCVPASSMRATVWPSPRDIPAVSSAHIGLFLGASEKDKHPDAAFWAELAAELLSAGHRPILLGGEAEKPLGQEVAKRLGAPALNLTGRFSIGELCRFLGELDLFVTPDTGPMHLAAWTGTPVLNLSTGPVNAWETGPFSPGNHVLRASLPCVGCWQCTQSDVLCKKALHAKRTAFLIHELAARKTTDISRISLSGQELLRTGRDAHNLFQLSRVIGEEPPRQITAYFWQAFFGNLTGIFSDQEVSDSWKAFAEGSPGNAVAFTKSLIKLSRDLGTALKGRSTSPVETDGFWADFPMPLRPLTSYLHLVLQNGLFQLPAFAKSLNLVERLIALR